LRLEVMESLAVSGSIINVLGNITWKDAQSERAPWRYRLSLEYLPMKATDLALGIEWLESRETRLAFGLERTLFNSLLVLRAGYLSELTTQRHLFSFGFGLNLSNYSFSYGLRIDDETATGIIHRFSLLRAFGTQTLR